MDFVSDILLDDRRFRILAIVTTSRANACARSPIRRCPGARVARELDGLVARRAKPLCGASDNGTELTSVAILR